MDTTALKSFLRKMNKRPKLSGDDEFWATTESLDFILPIDVPTIPLPDIIINDPAIEPQTSWGQELLSFIKNAGDLYIKTRADEQLIKTNIKRAEAGKPPIAYPQMIQSQQQSASNNMFLLFGGALLLLLVAQRK